MTVPYTGSGAAHQVATLYVQVLVGVGVGVVVLLVVVLVAVVLVGVWFGVSVTPG